MNRTIHCIIVDDEAVARDVLESHLRKIDQVKIVASCKNAVEAFKALNEHTVELIFLDINMPEIDGLSFARSVNSRIRVIFTTAYRDYAVDGFDLRAVDYLLKPVSFDRLVQAINKYQDEHNDNRLVQAATTLYPELTDSVYVRSDRKMIRIRFRDILYIESTGDYLKIYLPDKKVVTRETLSTLQAKLPGKYFLRTHRSFLVSVNYLDSYTSEYIEIGKHQIPVSRGYRDSVMKQLDRTD